jgi:hypothetical protein
VDVETFIARWKPSGGSERANFQQFAVELTDLLGVERPLPAQSGGQTDGYRFERPVQFFGGGNPGFVDLYRAGSFVMEAKQGFQRQPAADASEASPLADQTAPKVLRPGHGARASRRWDDTMLRARSQADEYARAVARKDGWPPFLLIVDVGAVIEVYADFSGQGQGYTQFPDGGRYRITMDELRDAKVRDRLRLIWTDPHLLDPAKVSAQVTRDAATRLAALGRSFEGQGHAPDDVARFLMRCLFTMFAEDVRLIPEHSFRDLLQRLRGHPQDAAPALQGLWRAMDAGTYSDALTTRVLRFNGGLFADATALPLDEVQLSLLIDAAGNDWAEVEPAIFGTLLERALDKRQRHKLGAHFTPRAYVERLVVPTVIEPLRADWRDVQAAALILGQQGKPDEAIAAVRAFHRQLCDTRVLDPACGSGNFLYVALELMKRLEGEVIAFLTELGDDQGALALAGHTVDPHQFLGIEVNPWAARVAELVLWIGYLQWHFRTYGKATPSEPVLRDFHNIECRDAVLDWDSRTERRDANGVLVTRWDGFSKILHPVTGLGVPDPEGRTQVYDYAKPRPAKWPDAEFIVGNPPFIGASRMREDLGDGYTEAIRKAYAKVPDSADFVMFWWEKAALAARAWNPAKGKGVRRFGLITTNSLRQTFNRAVADRHLSDPKTPLSLAFAIPDHPWVDAADGASVRIGMTVARAGRDEGRLLTAASEAKPADEGDGRAVTFNLDRGHILADLRIGADVAGAVPLKANEGLATRGVMLFGAGFIVKPAEALALGLGTVPDLEAHIRPYLNGRDLSARPRGVMVIDLFGLTEREVRGRFPAVYQHLLDKVKPERDQNNRPSRKQNWWLFGEPLSTFRPALRGVSRYIVTVETSKHRIFQFLDEAILPDNKLVAVALNGAADLAVLSSRVHVVWSLAAGSWLGVGNDPVYAKSKCFDPFPFPDATDDQKARLRDLGEQLDAHRKDRQAAHPRLTLTGMYNVLEMVRAGQTPVGRDRETYDQGLVGILRDLHDRIDREVAAAYGWPADLPDEEILTRLVALNRERADEEARGLIRWLRPEYQNPAGHAAVATESGKLALGDAATGTARDPWPKALPEQIAAVRAALTALGTATPDQIARRFTRAQGRSVQPLLDSLTLLGQARAVEGGRYAA